MNWRSLISISHLSSSYLLYHRSVVRLGTLPSHRFATDLFFQFLTDIFNLARSY